MRGVDTRPANTNNKQVTSPARRSNGQLEKGHTANPNGRPRKGMSMAEIVRAHKVEDKRLAAAKMFELAKDGDVQAFTALLRAEGVDKSGDTFNIDKAVLVRYVEGPD